MSKNEDSPRMHANAPKSLIIPPTSPQTNPTQEEGEIG